MGLEIMARPAVAPRDAKPPGVRRDTSGNVYEARLFGGELCFERMLPSGETAHSPARWGWESPQPQLPPATVSPTPSEAKRARRETGVVEQEEQEQEEVEEQEGVVVVVEEVANGTRV